MKNDKYSKFADTLGITMVLALFFQYALGLGISLLSYSAGIYFSSVTRKISQ